MIRNLSVMVLVNGEWVDVPITPELEADIDALHTAIEKDESDGEQQAPPTLDIP